MTRRIRGACNGLGPSAMFRSVSAPMSRSIAVVMILIQLHSLGECRLPPVPLVPALQDNDPAKSALARRATAFFPRREADWTPALVMILFCLSIKGHRKTRHEDKTRLAAVLIQSLRTMLGFFFSCFLCRGVMQNGLLWTQMFPRGGPILGGVLSRPSFSKGVLLQSFPISARFSGCFVRCYVLPCGPPPYKDFPGGAGTDPKWPRQSIVLVFKPCEDPFFFFSAIT